MMNTEFMKGVVVPILTVIDGEEKIDEAGMRDQVEYVIQGGVSGILAFGFACGNAPVTGLDALFRTELALFTVNGDTCHNHYLAVFLFRTFLQIKKNLECRFHNSLF